MVADIAFPESFKISRDLVCVCVAMAGYGGRRGHTTPTPVAKNKITEIMGCRYCY